jgi:hypothetical protein
MKRTWHLIRRHHIQTYYAPGGYRDHRSCGADWGVFA